jgi:hypothetical protein
MARGKRVVVQHLERVSWKVMDEYPHVVRDMIRNRSGVYALYRGQKLYYVGLASNLMRRLKQHLKDRHRGSWDRFSVYLTVQDEHMKELESLLLRIVDPVGNAVTGKFKDSENLRGKLSQRMRDADADRRAHLMGGKAVNRQLRKRSKKRRSEVRRPLEGVVDRRTYLRGWNKDYEYRATLRRDGTIRYGDVVYDTPSGAAKAALGRTSNGWWFWHYRNPKGEWVRLSTLRR